MLLNVLLNVAKSLNISQAVNLLTLANWNFYVYFNDLCVQDSNVFGLS